MIMAGSICTLHGFLGLGFSKGSLTAPCEQTHILLTAPYWIGVGRMERASLKVDIEIMITGRSQTSVLQDRSRHRRVLGEGLHIQVFILQRYKGSLHGKDLLRMRSAMKYMMKTSHTKALATETSQTSGGPRKLCRAAVPVHRQLRP